MNEQELTNIRLLILETVEKLNCLKIRVKRGKFFLNKKEKEFIREIENYSEEILTRSAHSDYKGSGSLLDMKYICMLNKYDELYR